MRWSALAWLTTAQIAFAGAAVGADPRYPDWPCVQAKVPALSVAAVWAGPSVDDIGDAWQRDPKLRDLVARLAARRTPLEDAQTLIAEFLAGPAAEKQQNAKLLFAGLFATLDGERREVMTALERFSGRRRELADRIRADVQQLRALQDAAGGDADKVSDLANQIAWETRIFEDRRRSIAYVCEVPQLIEQRLFALARAIQQALD